MSVNNRGDKIQSLVFNGSKNTCSEKKNGVREKMRRKLTSKEKPFTGILTHFTCTLGTHLVIVIFSESLKSAKFQYELFQS